MGSEPKPLRMQMRVKNNRMIKAREEMGHYTVASFCRFIGRPRFNATLGSYENFRTSPIRIARELISVCIASECEKKIPQRHVVCAEHRPLKDELIGDPNLTNGLPHVWTDVAIKIAEYLFREPEWLWPEEVRRVEKAMVVSVELEVNEAKLLSESASEDFSAMELKGKVSEVLDALSPRQRDIITRRFGLEGKYEQSLASIGRMQSCGKERMRQLEAKALRTLRHVDLSRHLKEFAGDE